MIYYEKITDYSMTDQTSKMLDIVHIFYITLLLFFFWLLFMPHSINKEKLLGFPLIILYFFIASQNQRSYLIFYYVFSIYFLSLKNEYLIILLQATSAHIIMYGTFGFDISLRAGNKSWGVNPDVYPIFTGFLFGVHKLSWYMIAGYGIMASEKFNELIKALVLRALTAIIVFLYIYFIYPSSSLPGFMWCMSQCLTLIISHSVGVLSFINKRQSEIKILEGSKLA